MQYRLMIDLSCSRRTFFFKRLPISLFEYIREKWLSIRIFDENNRIVLTILLLISWKCISQTLSTTSSEWNVTKPKPVDKKIKQ